MLPQKKSQLRRNAFYRQQLLQTMLAAETTAVGREAADHSSHNHSAQTANKVPTATKPGIVC